MGGWGLEFAAGLENAPGEAGYPCQLNKRIARVEANFKKDPIIQRTQNVWREENGN